MTKEPIGSLPGDGKEPVIERIFKLVERYPSRSAAARAWGININTLKNYYRRQDIQPTPRESQLTKIAEVEGVSLDWLKTGAGEAPKEPERTRHGSVSDKLTDMLSFLTEKERQGLTGILARKGIETVLYLLDENNIRLLQLPQVVKDQILAVHSDDSAHVAADDKKVCASTEEKDTTESRLVAKHKHAS